MVRSAMRAVSSVDMGAGSVTSHSMSHWGRTSSMPVSERSSAAASRMTISSAAACSTPAGRVKPGAGRRRTHRTCRGGACGLLGAPTVGFFWVLWAAPIFWTGPDCWTGTCTKPSARLKFASAR
jgi:hypothetical protein